MHHANQVLGQKLHATRCGEPREILNRTHRQELERQQQVVKQQGLILGQREVGGDGVDQGKNADVDSAVPCNASKIVYPV
jgi:hypothetical protein